MAKTTYSITETIDDGSGTPKVNVLAKEVSFSDAYKVLNMKKKIAELEGKLAAATTPATGN